MRHKNRRKHNQHFKLPLFKINLNFLTKFSSHKQYLFNFLSSRNAKKTDQSILCLKKKTHKHLTIEAIKKLFSSVYVTSFGECFLFRSTASYFSLQMIFLKNSKPIWKHVFFYHTILIYFSRLVFKEEQNPKEHLNDYTESIEIT